MDTESDPVIERAKRMDTERESLRAAIEGFAERFETSWSAWRAERRTVIVRRIVYASLATLACYAWLFDRLDAGRPLWQIALAIVAHCALSAAASLIYLYGSSIFLAVGIGFFSPDVAKLLLPATDPAQLVMSFAPLVIGMLVVPVLFRAPKEPEPPF